MRVVSLHADVLVATSRIWQTTCTIVRGASSPTGEDGPAGVETSAPITVHMSGAAAPPSETFVIDSPILPDELEILPALLEQARFPTPSGLLATHADWDHLLARLAFPDATLGCAVTSAERMRSNPGAAQRELRMFDEQHYVPRGAPLALGAVQALDTPGSCEIGSRELVLHPAEGHTSDGMIVWIGWASVLVAGDYLSPVEIPVLGEGGSIDAYLATLERLRPLVSAAKHIVPGHGAVLDSTRAATVLEQDVVYLKALSARAAAAELPTGRRTKAQRHIHAENVELARTG
ncbi:MAG TPA: MBL fold metallo-hydrolase [Solirubrobacteraceae bacterium]|nr:MBL fold metallo-hydrolase [Solirubrobacteraceae bacterium]